MAMHIAVTLKVMEIILTTSENFDFIGKKAHGVQSFENVLMVVFDYVTCTSLICHHLIQLWQQVFYLWTVWLV